MLGSLQRKIQIYKGTCKILHTIFGMGCLWILEKESRLWRNGEPQVIFEDKTLNSLAWSMLQAVLSTAEWCKRGLKSNHFSWIGGGVLPWSVPHLNGFCPWKGICSEVMINQQVFDPLVDIQQYKYIVLSQSLFWKPRCFPYLSVGVWLITSNSWVHSTCAVLCQMVTKIMSVRTSLWGEQMVQLRSVIWRVGKN